MAAAHVSASAELAQPARLELALLDPQVAREHGIISAIYRLKLREVRRDSAKC